MSLLLAPPTIEKLHALHWTDMAQSWEAQRRLPDPELRGVPRPSCSMPRARPPPFTDPFTHRRGAFRRLPGGYR